MKHYINRILPTTIRRDVFYTMIILILFVITPPLLDALCGPEQTEPTPAADYAVIVDKLVAVEEVGEDTDEGDKLETALVEQGYFRDDIPLTYELQDLLHTAAQEADIPYELALAVIKQETDFRNIVGDDGASAGYMQIQARWHADRMDKLGVNDLMDPAGNFRVGCSFLAELIERYGNIEDALTYYNSGHAGQSEYSRSVIGYMEASRDKEEIK